MKRKITILLDAFGKLHQVILLCLSAKNNLDHTGQILMKSDKSIFKKSDKKIQLPLKPDEQKAYFTRRPKYTFDNSSLSSPLNDKYARQKFSTTSKHIF